MKTTFIVKEAVIYTVGAMVVVTVGKVKLREIDLSGGRWPIAMGNALYRALRRLYPDLRREKVPRGNDDKV